MASLRRLARFLIVAITLLLLVQSASAEPPMMKEQSVRPRIEARSKDDRFSVALGGFLQARYTLAWRDTDLEVSRFDTPRTRLYVFGHAYSPNVRYRLMLGTPASSIQPELYDAYLDFRANDALRLRAGRFKIPVFREWVESARLLASVDRTILTQNLAPGRDWGILASGESFANQMEYAVGLFNGGGRVAEKIGTQEPLFAGRVVWNPMGRSIEGEVDFEDSPRTIVVGLSGYTSLARSASWISSGGLELAYRGHGLDVTLEVMGQTRETRGTGDTAAGFYARADKYIAPLRAGFGARATRLVGLNDPQLTKTEIELDAAYYPAEHDLKVATNVGITRKHEEHTWEPFVMVQAQAAF